MQTKLNIFGFIVMLTFLSSCSSSRPILDDDVYILKTAAIPIGENLLDETSYATFKYREDSNNPTTGYYNPMNESLRNNNGSISYVPSYFYTGMMYSIYNVGGFGNYMTLNPYTNYNPYGYYHNSGFNGYNSFYNNSFYNNSYVGYGSNSQYCGGYNNGSGFSSSTQGFVGNGHYVSGPRSTNSGYFSGTSRGGTQQLKVQIPNQQSNSSSFGNANPYSTVNRQTISRTSTVQNSSATTRLKDSSYERVNSNPNSSATKYNNQQARSVQSRGNGNYYSTESRSNSVRSTTYNNSSSRSSGSVSVPSQRSTGGSTTTPSRSTSTPASSSGGRRQ